MHQIIHSSIQTGTHLTKNCTRQRLRWCSRGESGMNHTQAVGGLVNSHWPQVVPMVGGWNGQAEDKEGEVARDFMDLNFKGYKNLHNNIKRLYSETALSLRLKRDMCTLWAGDREPLSTNERMSDTWEKGREGGQLGGSKQPLLTLSLTCPHHSQKKSPCSKLDFESFTRQFGNYLM